MLMLTQANQLANVIHLVSHIFVTFPSAHPTVWGLMRLDIPEYWPRGSVPLGTRCRLVICWIIDDSGHTTLVNSVVSKSTFQFDNNITGNMKGKFW